RLLDTQPAPVEDLRDTLHEILNDNKRAGDVVRRLRALLRKGGIAREPVEVNGTVTEVVKLVQNNALARGVVLDVELTPSLEPVLGDRIQIQQVVLNLLMNAFDAVQECRGPDRRVALRTSPRDLMAVIDVTDRGNGMSDDALALLFEPFFTTKKDGM